MQELMENDFRLAASRDNFLLPFSTVEKSSNASQIYGSQCLYLTPQLCFFLGEGGTLLWIKVLDFKAPDLLTHSATVVVILHCGERGPRWQPSYLMKCSLHSLSLRQTKTSAQRRRGLEREFWADGSHVAYSQGSPSRPFSAAHKPDSSLKYLTPEKGPKNKEWEKGNNRQNK